MVTADTIPRLCEEFVATLSGDFAQANRLTTRSGGIVRTYRTAILGCRFLLKESNNCSAIVGRGLRLPHEHLALRGFSLREFVFGSE
jgi:hypothetical protein